MNERVLLHCCCNVVVIGGYRGAYRGLSTHSSTGMTSSMRATAAQPIHSGKDVHRTQSCRPRRQNNHNNTIYILGRLKFIFIGAFLDTQGHRTQVKNNATQSMITKSG